MDATFVSKKSSCILELYRVIHFDANYFKQLEIVPLNTLLTYQHGFNVAYCSNMVFTISTLIAGSLSTGGQ